MIDKTGFMSKTILESAATGTAPPSSSSSIQAERIDEVRRALMNLGLHCGDPRWSSDVLDRILKTAMDKPNGSVEDIIRALFKILGYYSPELNSSTAHLIKEIVVNCFTRYRTSYDSVEWNPIVDNLKADESKSQLYLALHAIPPQFINFELAKSISEGLHTTLFREEAEQSLSR